MILYYPVNAKNTAGILGKKDLEEVNKLLQHDE